MKFKRSERVGDLIHSEIAKIISLELRDPRVGFVTITEVDLSRDLKNMIVYVSVMGDKTAQENSIIGLVSSLGFIKKNLAKRLYLKRLPEIIFKLDHSVECHDKISGILREIKKNDEEVQ